jgi:hypothetical protein
VANISYTPTFHHRPWRDRVDRVEAGGPNGFNGRFAAIESDLQQVSTVVTQVGAELDQIGGGRLHRLAFTPTLQTTDGPFPTWGVGSDGAPTVTLTSAFASGGATAVVNLDLPHGARVTGMRVRGQYGGTANPATSISTAINLLRVPRLTNTPGSFDDFAIAGETNSQRTGPFDFTGIILDQSMTLVDLDTFRYVMAFMVATTESIALTVTLETVEITYLAR